jgi:hypothetical protein
MVESACTQSLCDFFTKINCKKTLTSSALVSVVQNYCQSVVEIVPNFMNDSPCIDREHESERLAFVNKFGTVGQMTHCILKTSAQSGSDVFKPVPKIKIMRNHETYLALIDHILHILQHVPTEPLDKTALKSMTRITLRLERDRIQHELDFLEPIHKLLNICPDESKVQRIREIEVILSGMSDKRHPVLDTLIYNHLMTKKIQSYRDHLNSEKKRRDGYVKNMQIGNAGEKRKCERELCQSNKKR